MIDIDVSKIASEIGEPSARFIENVEDRRQKNMIAIFSFVFLFLFLVGSLVFVFLSRSTAVKAENLGREVESLKSDNSRLLDLEKQGKEIEKRNASIIDIINSNPNWSFVFGKLEEVIPKGITFSRFEVDSAGNMKVVGISQDYTTLSKLVVSMQESGFFNNVTLANAALANVSSRSVVEFSVGFGFTKKIDNSSTSKSSSSSSDFDQDKAKEVQENILQQLPTDSSENSNPTIPIENKASEPETPVSNSEGEMQGGNTGTLPSL